jgi:hypothetical protein
MAFDGDMTQISAAARREVAAGGTKPSKQQFHTVRAHRFGPLTFFK